MIITVTLNPALDKTLYVDNFKSGIVNRTSSVRTDIGGKGINVSKVLKNFGVDSICTGFLGGNLKSYFIDELESRGIKTDFIYIKEDTRTNIKIVDTLNGVYTDINEKGPDISDSELTEFIENFKKICREGDIVVLSGGVSPSIPNHIYKELISFARERGAFTILDADGDLLREGLEAKPDLIKPNEFEFMKLTGIEHSEISDIAHEALRFARSGTLCMVSLGERGALYADHDSVNYLESAKVEVKSTVGAGDSMVAALVYSLINKFDPKKTLSYAVASGAASVSLEGTEACTLKQVESFLNDKIVKMGVD